jgi:pimeloyl-ACP methyl ester carboxylesterase
MASAVRSAPTPRAGVDAFFAIANSETWARLPEIRREAARSNHAALFATLSLPPYALRADALRAITVPVRLLTGARAPQPVQEVAGRIAALVPDADLVRLDGAGHLAYFDESEAFSNAGHLAHVDQPQAFSEAVRSFARRLIMS